MAEFFSEIANAAANKNASASGDSSHYSLPVYEWFGNDARYNFPTNLTAELGSANNPSYHATHNTDVISQNPIFNTFEGSDGEKGFEIKKTSASNAHSAIVEIRGGTGHWMPAPIFRTLSFFWKNYNNADSNYRVYTPGLTLRNWKTNATKRWTAGWENAADSSPSGTIKPVSGLGKAEEVNALGPDWIVYGVWFYLLSNSTSTSQTTRSALLDLRFGWHNPIGGGGSYKMIIPDKMSWDDYRAMKERGEVKFYSLSSRTSASISTDVTSAQTGQKVNISWEATGGSKYILHGIRDGAYNEVYDAVSASGTYEYYSNRTGSFGFTIKVLDSDDNVIDSAAANAITITASTASISSSNTNPEKGEQYVISWNCTGGNSYIHSDRDVSASGSANKTRNGDGSITQYIKVISADGSTVVAEDSVVVTTKVVTTASISADKERQGYNEPVTITWSASGASSYKLYGSDGHGTQTVSSSGSKTFTGRSSSGTNYYRILLFDSNGNEIRREQVNVSQLGKGRLWRHGATAGGSKNNWKYDSSSLTKFHNTDKNNISQLNYFKTFQAGTYHIRIGEIWGDVYFPAPSAVNNSNTGVTKFPTGIKLPGSGTPPANGTEIEIYEDYP
jgi:hypothetical protein